MVVTLGGSKNPEVAGVGCRTAALPNLVGVLLATFALSACGGNKPKNNQIFLMPAPGIYEEGDLDPFIDQDPISLKGVASVLYATDREPADADDRRYDYYTHERGRALRLGAASTRLGVDEEIAWEEARRISLLKNRTQNYPVEVDDVEEFGVLEPTVRPFDPSTERSREPGRRFAEEVNRRLARSDTKDVYIYVHGYKVNFENPILVASELWHFLGYRGAFIAYSWPTKFSMWAYLADLDSALNSSRNLRSLIVHIAENTDAERIHILGYSMGTRLVARTVADLGMYTAVFPEEDVRSELRLGHVLLVASDIDQSIFGNYLLDGALRVTDSLTIYQSQDDGALGMARRIFGRERTGQVFRNFNEFALEYLEGIPEFRMIDVTEAEGGTDGGGHSYLRSSPWVSSDILMAMLYNLEPQDRGLVKREGEYAWSFPEDYVSRLREAIGKANSDLAATDR